MSTDLSDLLGQKAGLPPDPEPPLPLYLDPAQTTEQAIRSRVLGAFPPPYDLTEGGFPWDTTAPAVLELAQAAAAMRFSVSRVWAQTATGDDLDQLVVLAGIEREPAASATVAVRFYLQPGAVVPAGTECSTTATILPTGVVPVGPGEGGGTALLPVSGSIAQVFVTQQEAAAPAGGTPPIQIDVPVVARTPGAAGNVPAGTITLLVRPVPGVIALTNPVAAGGGQDEEADAALRERFLAELRTPSAGGNRADYERWAGEVPGVGSVFVAGPTEGSPPVREGHVRLTLADPVGLPAPWTVCDAALRSIVRNRHVPPDDPAAGSSGQSGQETGPGGPDSWTLAGGAVLEDEQVRLTPGASASISRPGTGDASLDQPGVWVFHARLRREAPASGPDLNAETVVLTVTDTSTGVPLYQRPLDSGAPPDLEGTQAVRSLTGNDLPADGGDPLVELSWPGIDLYWPPDRPVTATVACPDTAPAGAVVWLDLWRFRSTFEDDRRRDGKSPIGHRVAVRPALAVTIDVEAVIEGTQGFDQPTVLAGCAAAVRAYLQSLARLGREDREVQYVRIGALLLTVQGVEDYTGLLLNGGEGNVPLALEEVPVEGALAFTAAEVGP